jgi:hypothetical protein
MSVYVDKEKATQVGGLHEQGDYVLALVVAWKS